MIDLHARTACPRCIAITILPAFTAFEQELLATRGDMDHARLGRLMGLAHSAMELIASDACALCPTHERTAE